MHTGRENLPFYRKIEKVRSNHSLFQVHLLCLLARGFYINHLCSDETLQAQAMSISMTTRELRIATVKSCDVTGLSYIITWLKGAFPLKSPGVNQSDDLVSVWVRNKFHYERRKAKRRKFFLPYKFYVLGQTGLIKQCRPRSDCF